MICAKDMRIGEKTVVKEVRLSGDALKRISDMGLTPGAEIVLVGKAPLGDPLLFEVRGFYMAVRKSVAAEIFVSEKPSEEL